MRNFIKVAICALTLTVALPAFAKKLKTEKGVVYNMEIETTSRKLYDRSMTKLIRLIGQDGKNISIKPKIKGEILSARFMVVGLGDDTVVVSRSNNPDYFGMRFFPVVDSQTEDILTPVSTTGRSGKTIKRNAMQFFRMYTNGELDERIKTTNWGSRAKNSSWKSAELAKINSRFTSEDSKIFYTDVKTSPKLSKMFILDARVCQNFVSNWVYENKVAAKDESYNFYERANSRGNFFSRFIWTYDGFMAVVEGKDLGKCLGAKIGNKISNRQARKNQYVCVEFDISRAEANLTKQNCPALAGAEVYEPKVFQNYYRSLLSKKEQGKLDLKSLNEL